MKKSDHLTPGEFELMEILWPLGEASVKDVWLRVSPERHLAYTTVMTVLEKMHRKGYLGQRKKGKAFLYSAIINRKQVLKGIIDHIRSTYFAGSQEQLATFITQYGTTDLVHPEAPQPGGETIKPSDAGT
jgi:BlaI family transcriptional regulator, penicillinase repressor